MITAADLDAAAERRLQGAQEHSRIIVIDDDYAMRFSCRKILEKSGFDVSTFENGMQGLEAVARIQPSLAILDLKMPGMSGMEVLQKVHGIDPDLVVVVITGYATIDTAVEAMKSGAYDFLPKPFSPEELRLIVNRGLERRRLTLETRRSELERMLLKRRFVTFVSHQLQAPLVAVRQYLEVMQHLGNSTETAAKRDEWLARCVQRTAEMQQMIQDWLSLARMEGDAFSRAREKVDVNAVSINIVRNYEQVAAAEHISLSVRPCADPCFVLADPQCVAVVIDNLVMNAIKYNRRGGDVGVSTEAIEGSVIISVADTGIGIEQKHIPYLFDEFYRIRSDGAKKVGGSGLGLAICKKVVSEMGGTIGVQSVPGKGSTFRVCVPAWRAQARTAHEHDPGCG